MAHDTTGVGMIGRLLSHVASHDPCRAAELARRLGTARTTTFHLLLRLEQAGFVDRDPQGYVSPGLASADLGFAACGIVRGAGSTEALLSVFHEETEADIELVVFKGQDETVLARRYAAGMADAGRLGEPAVTLEETVWTKGDVRAVLRATPRAISRTADRAAIGRCLKRVAGALSHSFSQASEADAAPRS